MELEIVAIPAETALSVFTTPGLIDPYLTKVRSVIDGFTADVGTRSGRKEIASFAARISKYKVALEEAGKAVADDQKLVPKKIDATRKLVKDTLDQWRDEVRQPLTDWEDADKARIAKHEAAIALLGTATQNLDGRSADELRGALARAEDVSVGSHCEEYEEAYARAKADAVSALNRAIAARERYEAEQAELQKLRQEAAERAARDREEAIRKEAAEQARLAAEQAAKAETDRIEAQARAAQEAAERAAQDAERQAHAEREAAARREADLKAEAEAARLREAETEDRLKREIAETARLAALEAVRREADARHRGAINRKAVAALVEGGISEDVAKKAVTLIAKRVVPNVTISY